MMWMDTSTTVTKQIKKLIDKRKQNVPRTTGPNSNEYDRLYRIPGVLFSNVIIAKYKVIPISRLQ